MAPRAVTLLQLSLAALVALSSIAASFPYQNDAGSGADGSDLAAAPTSIPDYGAYSGTSRSNDDRDWFSVTNATTAAGLSCSVLDASGDTFENVTLAISTASGDRALTATLPDTSAIRLALAGTPTRTLVGLVPVPNAAGNQPARPGSYHFQIQGYTLSDLGKGDAGAGMGIDAGTGANALPLEGPCTRGTLMPLAGVGDTNDAYTFTVDAAGQIVYTLSSASGVTLTVLDASGQPIPGSAITNGGIGALTLPAGSYSMNAAATSGTSPLDYVIGMTGGGPGNPCRPTCV